MPDDIPEEFEIGELLSAAALNRLQQLILDQLAGHDHTGGAKGATIAADGLADGSVITAKLADKSVTEPKLADGAVSTRVLENGAVRATHIADDAVTTDAIIDAAVTQDKLSPEVLALLLRVGGGASSASQVIWRSPIYVFPIDDGPTLIEGINDPTVWRWDIPVVSINDRDEPIRFNPNIDPEKTIDVIDFKLDQSEELVLIERRLNIAASDMASDLMAVGAIRFTEAEFDAPQDFAATGAGTIAPMMMRMAPMEETATRSTAQPAARIATAATQPAARSTTAAAQPALTVTSSNGKSAAKRGMTIATVDPDGRPVAAGSADAITVSAGFGGQDSFYTDGGAIDYRNISGSNAGAQTDAAEAAGLMLFNLGIDDDYAEGAKLSTEVKAQLTLAFQGDKRFLDPDRPLWGGGKSWLPDILYNPHLFGTGYALSGGRNVLSVTRQFRRGAPEDHWVRVRFVTPYRNASYAVTVTPRTHGTYKMISANIRAKATQHVDIEFTGAAALDGDAVRFDRLSKLSFDLAVFGELGQVT